MKALVFAFVMALATTASAQWAYAPGASSGLTGDWNRGATIQAYGPGWGYRATGIQPSPVYVAPRPYYSPYRTYYAPAPRYSWQMDEQTNEIRQLRMQLWLRDQE